MRRVVKGPLLALRAVVMGNYARRYRQEFRKMPEHFRALPVH